MVGRLRFNTAILGAASLAMLLVNSGCIAEKITPCSDAEYAQMQETALRTARTQHYIEAANDFKALANYRIACRQKMNRKGSGVDDMRVGESLIVAGELFHQGGRAADGILLVRQGQASIVRGSRDHSEPISDADSADARVKLSDSEHDLHNSWGVY